MTQAGTIVGTVEFRPGDGAMMRIPQGPVDIVIENDRIVQIASIGSPRNSLISRCSAKVEILLLRPSMNAVIAWGVRSMLRA